MKNKRLTRLLPLMFLLLAGGVFRAGVPTPDIEARTNTSCEERLDTMANPQITIGGPAVTIPVTTLGNSPGGGSWTFNSTGALVSKPDGTLSVTTSGSPNPSSSSDAYLNVIFNSLGTNTTVSGHSYPNYSVQALAGSLPGTYAINEYDGSTKAYGLFDVVAAPPPSPPNAPTGMTATAGYAPTKVVWSWVAPTSGPTPDSYNLYTGTFPGSETLRQSGITALSFTDTAVVLRVPNSGYVKAVKGGLEGPASLRAVLTVVTPPAGCGMCPPMF